MSETGSWGFQEGLSDLSREPWVRGWALWSPHGGGREAGRVPVLNGLRSGRRPEFGHKNADNVEKEDKIDL